MSIFHFQQVASKCGEDEADDRVYDAAMQFGLAPTADPAVLASQLRPVIPRQLRSLNLDPDHFSSETFGQRSFNEILAYILVNGESNKILRDQRSPSWVHDLQCNPSNRNYVGPSGLTKM